MFRLRTLVEDDVYTGQLETLGYREEHLDAALSAVAWALAVNPEHYDVVPGTRRLRVVKTDHYSREDVWIPRLKIWYTIEDENTVLLRGITLAEEIINES